MDLLQHIWQWLRSGQKFIDEHFYITSRWMYGFTFLAIPCLAGISFYLGSPGEIIGYLLPPWILAAYGFYRWHSERTPKNFVGVYVLLFDGITTEEIVESRRVQSIITSNIHNLIERERLGNFKHYLLPLTIKSSAQAKAVGLKLNASIIIWGQVIRVDDRLAVKPKVSVLKFLGKTKDRLTVESEFGFDIARLTQVEMPFKFEAQVAQLLLFIEGLLKLETENYQDAALCFQAALEQGYYKMPAELVDVAYYLVLACVHSKRFADARNVLSTAVEHNPSDAHLYHMLNMASFFELTYADASGKEISIEDKDRFLANAIRASQLDPNNAMYHYNLAEAYTNLNRVTEALREFDEAARLSPSYAKAWYVHKRKGSIYYNSGRLEEAKTEYSEALKDRPLDPTNLRFLGDCHFNLGEYEKAYRMYDKSMRMQPSREAFDGVQSAIERLGEENELVKQYRQEETAAGQLDHQAASTLTIDNQAKAIGLLNQVIKICPCYGFGVTFYNLGLEYHKAGLWKESVGPLESAIRILPQDVEAMMALGFSYLNMGKDERVNAMRWCNRAFKMDFDKAKEKFIKTLIDSTIKTTGKAPDEKFMARIHDFVEFFRKGEVFIDALAEKGRIGTVEYHNDRVHFQQDPQ